MAFLALWILFDQRDGLASGLAEIVLLTILFTALSMMTGFVIGSWKGFSVQERLTLVIEYSGRNLGIDCDLLVAANPSNSGGGLPCDADTSEWDHP